MEYVDMVLKLQQLYYDRIVLVSCGPFYIAVGADALTLHDGLGLKLNCIKKEVCKIGIPINSIERYIFRLNNLGCSYVILNYNGETNEIKKNYRKANI